MREQNRNRKQKLPRLVEGSRKSEEPLWMSGGGQIVSALSLGSERKECHEHETSYLLSHHHLNRHSDKMRSTFLCIPIGRRRARSRARSEIGSIEDPSETGEAVIPRPAESTPDFRIDTSTSPPSSPLTPRDQDSNGMQTNFFRTICLTTPNRATQTAPPFLIVFDLFSEENKAAIRNLQIALLAQKQCP